MSLTSSAESPFRFVFVALALPALAAIGVAGCASAKTTPPTLTGNTSVTLLATSTANGQLFNFTLELQTLSLTSQDGKTTVAFLSSPVGEEFIHVNGSAEPLATSAVPQGVYTSATATVAFVDPACAGAYFFDSALSTPQTTEFPPVTVKLPQPITVTGTTMALALDLQVANSVPFSGGCDSSLTDEIPVTPLFNLKAVNASGTSFFNLLGIVGAVTANNEISVKSLSDVNAPNNPAWDFTVNGATVYQGVSGLSELVAGIPVDLDAVLQSDGSLLITRIEALDTNPADVGVAYGPINGRYTSRSGRVDALETQFQGEVFTQGLDSYALPDSAFYVSRQMGNLADLPFMPVFKAATIADGQNVVVVSHAQLVNGFPPGPPLPVTSMTLMPQTIDGTISVIGTAGAFTTYAVTLAPYDLFPAFASQKGQTPQPAAPGTIVVYAGAGTRNLSSSTPAVGGVFHFTGLVFNDNGVLRMDCAQIFDGVPE
jgi:hypothetical protein